jgi:hypothetical protein
MHSFSSESHDVIILLAVTNPSSDKNRLHKNPNPLCFKKFEIHTTLVSSVIGSKYPFGGIILSV